MPNLRLLSVIAEPGLTPHLLPIFSGGMPHLETITLPFFSYGQQLAQLTHLATMNITVDDSALADVFGLFANNPKLKCAVLCGSFRGKSCLQQHGAVRMGSLRQLDLLSWDTNAILPFLALNKGAHIRVFGPTSPDAGSLFPTDTTFLPNLASLKQFRWYLMSRDMLMEFTGPN